MASPHYTGLDETNGRLPVVEDITALAAQNGGYPGRAVWVQSVRKLFILDPFSADTADNVNIVACATSGQWRAELKPGLSSAKLTPATLTDANATKTVSQGSEFTLPAATLTTNRTGTLSTTGAVTGEVVRITREDVTAFTYAVVNGGAGAGTLYTFPVSVARVADFRYDGTNWALAAHAAITI